MPSGPPFTPAPARRATGGWFTDRDHRDVRAEAEAVGDRDRDVEGADRRVLVAERERLAVQRERLRAGAVAVVDRAGPRVGARIGERAGRAVRAAGVDGAAGERADVGATFAIETVTVFVLAPP